MRTSLRVPLIRRPLVGLFVGVTTGLLWLAGVGSLPGCKSGSKLNALDYVPADVPAIVWLPNVKDALQGLKQTTDRFEREPLGDQLKAFRFDLGRELGFDPFDSKALEQIGLQLDRPLCVLFNTRSELDVVLLPAEQPQQLATELGRLMEKRYGKLEEQRGPKGNILLREVLGNERIDVIAYRPVERALVVAIGSESGSKLAAFPTADELRDKPYPHTLKQFRKKAEADGTSPGAVVRALVRDHQGLIPAELAAPAHDTPIKGGTSAVEFHLAAFVGANQWRIEAQLMGLQPQLLAAFSAPVESTSALAAMPKRPLFLLRSDLESKAMAGLLTKLPALSGLLGQRGQALLGSAVPNAANDKALSPDELAPLVESFASTFSGTFSAAVTVGDLAAFKGNTPKAAAGEGKRPGREQLYHLLDLFPIRASFAITDTAGFDALQKRLAEWLNAHGVKTTLEPASNAGASGAVLRSTSITGAEVALFRRDKLGLYAIGPTAVSELLAAPREALQAPKLDPPFTPLQAPHTSGWVLNTAELVPLVEQLVGVILGGENMMVRTLVGRTLQSLRHLQDISATLMFEGPAAGPHPTLRLQVNLQ